MGNADLRGIDEVRIALLSGASSIHTIRWANGLAEARHEVHLITQHPQIDPLRADVIVHQFPFRGVLGYFTMVPAVRRLLHEIEVEVLNAHFASGYGTTARLVGFHPWVMSLWGSDVYDFPNKSPLHKYVVRKNILAADCVASTSHCMAEQAYSLAPELSSIHITPFGVDMDHYGDIELPDSGKAGPVVIGTVKTMAPKYGVSTLLHAFSLLRKKVLTDDPNLGARLQLRLVGDGPQMRELQTLAGQLGIAGCTNFVGRVPHAKVPEELAKLDVFVALSEIESFGVAVIEAGAASRPVVVSDAGGLPEVTLDGVTGFVVPRNRPEAAADAIERLVLDADLRRRLGIAGREHVATHYSWRACVGQMAEVYKSVLG